MHCPDFITHMHVKSRFNDQVDDWVKTISAAISLVVKRNLSATRNQLINIIKADLNYQFESQTIPPSIWVSDKGERYINIIVTLFDIGKMKFKVIVPSLRTPEEIQKKARYDLGYLIGDLSQDVYECSYNDFDVYVGWKSKTLNSYWSEMSESFKDNLRTPHNRQLFIEYCNKPGWDWEALLDGLYEKAQGWPTDWLDSYKTPDELSTLPYYQYTEAA